MAWDGRAFTVCEGSAHGPPRLSAETFEEPPRRRRAGLTTTVLVRHRRSRTGVAEAGPMPQQSSRPCKSQTDDPVKHRRLRRRHPALRTGQTERLCASETCTTHARNRAGTHPSTADTEERGKSVPPRTERSEDWEVCRRPRMLCASGLGWLRCGRLIGVVGLFCGRGRGSRYERISACMLVKHIAHKSAGRRALGAVTTHPTPCHIQHARTSSQGAEVGDQQDTIKTPLAS